MMWVNIFFGLLLGLQGVASYLTFDPDDFKLCVNNTQRVEVHIDEIVRGAVFLTVDHKGLIEISPDTLYFDGENETKSVDVFGLTPGKVVVSANFTGEYANSLKVKSAHIIVQKQDFWNIISEVVGWLYFTAWSVSFYSQMYENWRRRSVIGLSFDFLSLNLVGFSLYSLFNICLYASEPIQAQYEERFPKGVIPVKLNDIFFSVHATLAVIFTCIQCLIYERGDQTVSKFVRCIFVGYGIFLGISLILASTTDFILWLDFFLFCSYVKLSTTLIKYVPQAYMNFKRKSTVGWNIGGVLLDITGGIFSMLQMIINAYNFNDWVSIFGDPTKFGLGLFSALFDLFFIIQHYGLYRRRGTTV